MKSDNGRAILGKLRTVLVIILLPFFIGAMLVAILDSEDPLSGETKIEFTLSLEDVASTPVSEELLLGSWVVKDLESAFPGLQTSGSPQVTGFRVQAVTPRVPAEDDGEILATAITKWYEDYHADHYRIGSAFRPEIDPVITFIDSPAQPFSVVGPLFGGFVSVAMVCLVYWIVRLTRA